MEGTPKLDKKNFVGLPIPPAAGLLATDMTADRAAELLRVCRDRITAAREEVGQIVADLAPDAAPVEG